MPHWRKPHPPKRDHDELAGFVLFVVLVICLGSFIIGVVGA